MPVHRLQEESSGRRRALSLLLHLGEELGSVNLTETLHRVAYAGQDPTPAAGSISETTAIKKVAQARLGFTEARVEG